MPYAVGETVRIDFPADEWHGRAVEVVRDDPAVEVGHEDGTSMIARVIFVRGPGIPHAVGFHASHIAGTVEAQQRRRWDAEGDDRQGMLGL
jgi:hypothetical protein